MIGRYSKRVENLIQQAAVLRGDADPNVNTGIASEPKHRRTELNRFWPRSKYEKNFGHD
jgi:hypothetical protein